MPQGSVLITGGTGAIGGHAARWLAGRGCPHLMLTSRSGPAAARTAALAAGLARAGTRVSVLAADTGCREQIAGVLAWADATGPELCGVLHTAGLVQDTPLEEATVAGLGEVLAAKAGGAVHLHELTAGLGLDVFVLCSSIAATWGSGRQPGYAAANAFLDGLAGYRRAAGLPATSLAWGPWDGGGMTSADGAAYLRRRGLAAMDPVLAVRALAQAIDHGEEQVTIADVDWARFMAPFTLRRPAPLLSILTQPSVTPSRDTAAAETGTPLTQRLAGLPLAEQDRVLLDLVRAEAAAVLGHSTPEAVEPGRAFSDLGFDSLTAVELRNRLCQATGLPLPATLLFDYPAPLAAARFLRGELGGHTRTTAGHDDMEGSTTVMAELDKLESMLSDVSAENGESAMITARLETLTSRWKELRERADETAAFTEKLKSSTDEEVFDFIGKELGIFWNEQ